MRRFEENFARSLSFLSPVSIINSVPTGRVDVFGMPGRLYKVVVLNGGDRCGCYQVKADVIPGLSSSLRFSVGCVYKLTFSV